MNEIFPPEDTVDTEAIEDAVSTSADIKPTLQKRVLSRRNFFKLMLGAGVATYTAGAVKPETVSAAPDEKNTAVAASEEERPIESKVEFDGGLIFLNLDNFPFAYQLNGQEKTYFTAEQIVDLRDSFNAAVENQESMLAIQLHIALPIEMATPTAERPYVTAAPEDILSAAELQANGVTIINQLTG